MSEVWTYMGMEGIIFQVGDMVFHAPPGETVNASKDIWEHGEIIDIKEMYSRTVLKIKSLKTGLINLKVHDNGVELAFDENDILFYTKRMLL